MTDPQFSQPQRPPAVVMFLMAMLLAVWIVCGFVWLASMIDWRPQPGPDDPDPPAPISDDVERDAIDSIHTVAVAARKCRGRSHREVDDEIYRVCDYAFDAVNRHLESASDSQYAEIFGEISRGFSRAADDCRRSRDGPVGTYAAVLSRNFTDAQRAVKRRDDIADIHDRLHDANDQAKQELVDSLASGRSDHGESFFGFGYLIDEENRDELIATQTPIPLRQLAVNAPAEIDPRGWHRIEDQGQMGSCQGHALSSVCEFAYYIGQHDRRRSGSPRQFSPMFAYLASQKHDGILGRDVGSTIAGGLKAAMEDGSCPLEIFPYPNPVRYSPTIPPRAFEAARPFRIGRHTVCRSYQDVFDFLASGQGGVEVGIRWPDSWMNCSGILESYNAGYGGGGHAVCFLGYSRRVDSRGRKYLWLANSWGREWGNQGYAEVSPQAVDQMAQHQDTVMVGLSDMAVDDVRPRDVSWIGDGSVFGPMVIPPNRDVPPVRNGPVKTTLNL